MQFSRNILDKAYSYNPRSSTSPEDNLHNHQDNLLNTLHNKPYKKSQLHPDVIQLVKGSDIQCYSRVVAPKGFYTIPTEAGVGNSYICFAPFPDEGVDWVAGQIHYIFEQTGSIYMVIKRSIELSLTSPDPFAEFWEGGFQAKMVSTKFSDKLEVVNASRILAHAARWELTPEIAVVLNLCAVRMASRLDMS